MSKTVLIIIVLASLLASAFFTYRWRKADAERRESVAWMHEVMDSLSTAVEFPKPPYQTGVRDSVYWQWVATGATLRLRMAQEAIRHWAGVRSTLLEEYEIAMLKNDGLEDPLRQLRESLTARSDLIPYPGVLGGTMAFHDDGIVLLSRPYAFATFEDGHEQGSMLLSYSVKPGGGIEWTRLWATLE